MEHEKGYTVQILIIKNLPLLSNRSRRQNKEYYWDREAFHSDKETRYQEAVTGDFAGGPVVKTSPFNAAIPGPGPKIPHAS